MVFQQTNIELWSFSLGPDGVVQSAVALPLTTQLNTVQCGSSLTISPTLGLVLLVSNAEVVAYSIGGFSPASRPAWRYSYPSPGTGYVLSEVAEDTDSQSMLFTFSRAGWGSDIVALSSKTGSKLWSTFYSFPGGGGLEVTSIASTPLVRRGRAYVSLYPLGLVVLDLATGSIVNNGSYVLAQATGVSPSLWIDGDSATATERLVYECATDDSISSTYKLCVSDTDGNEIRPWGDLAIVLGCYNDSVLTSYGVVSQPLITRNGMVVSASSSSYDMLSCVQVFSLHTGRQQVHYQDGPLNSALIFASPFADQFGHLFVMAASNDFTSTLLDLAGLQQGQAEKQGRRRRRAEEEEEAQRGRHRAAGGRSMKSEPVSYMKEQRCKEMKEQEN